jgi:DNA-binding NarL/FixJ family response regulator
MKSSIVKKPSIILVDDHLIFRQGLKSLITFDNLGTVIGEAADGKEFLKLLTPPIPDLVFMDIDMPNMNGMEAAEKALTMIPELKIIVFSMFGDEDYFNKMIEIGVKGFILKSSGITDVEQAISDVMLDKKYFSSVLPNKNSSRFNTLNEGDQEQEPQVPIPWW